MLRKKRSFFDRAVRWGRHQLGWRVLNVGLRLRSPQWIATGYSLLTIPVAKDRPYKVFVITKDILQEDILAIGEFAGKVGFVTLGAGAFNKAFYEIGKGRIEGLSQQTYYQSDKWDAPKQEYYDLLMKVLPVLKDKIGFQAVVAASWSYASHQELGRALRDLGIPFVVLYKEGMAVQGREEEQSDIWSREFFSGPITATRILTYNKRIAERILRMRVSGVSPEMLRPIGVPRMDVYRHANISTPARKQLTFFPFSVTSPFFYFRELNDPAQREATLRKIEPIVTQVYSSLLEFARRRPDVDVVLKVKRGSEPVRFSLGMIDRITDGKYRLAERSRVPEGQKIIRLSEPFTFPDIPNLRITDEWIAMDLIARSTCVLGLNSTTLLEALMMGRRVITPDFTEVFPDSVWHFFQNYPGLLRYVRTAEDFERVIDEPLVIDADYRRERDRLLRDYCVCGMDELSSSAAQAELIDAIESASARSAA